MHDSIIPPRVKNLQGRKFGRWIVRKYAGKRKGDHYWWCRCACGTRRPVSGSNLTAGLTASCGCYAKENPVRTTHGMCGTREYSIWGGMLTRCTNTKAVANKRYGGRGIRVCPRWMVFENFYADMGRCPSAKHTLERVDNNGHYEPGNVIWATYKQQARNTRRNRILVHNGESKPLVVWAEEFQISQDLVRDRLCLGWSVHDALTRPKTAKLDMLVEFCGETKMVSDWARVLGIRYGLLIGRIRSGWSVERAFAEPVRMRAKQ